MPHGSSLELLECRIAPAGVVKVTVTAGVLNLEGDPAANDVTVAETAPGVLAITGNHETQVSFAGVTDTSASVTLPVTTLTADLGGGNDVLALKNLTLTKDVTVTDGSGSDTVTIGNNADLAKASFKSSVKIVGGTENDTFNDNMNIYAVQPVFLP